MSETNRTRPKLTHAEWRLAAEERYGKSVAGWKFRCPVCGHVASVQDWIDAKAPEGAMAFSCVGRWLPDPKTGFTRKKNGGPCDYAGGGLFRLNPVLVVKEGGEEMQAFDFADRPLAEATR